MDVVPIPSSTTVAGILRLAALRTPRNVAVVAADGRRVTYAQLLDDAGRLGNALLAVGLERGDRVAAWMEDSLEYVQVYTACAVAGLVVVPINARLTVHEAAFPVEDSDAKVLVATDGLVDKAASLASDVGIPLVGVTASPGVTASVGRLLREGSGAAHPEPSPTDLYMIGYTSGTTGKPKGAMLTQGSVATLARMNSLSYRLPVGSVCALTGSMSFVAVVPAHIITHFYVGGTVLILGKWDVPSLLDLIERERVTFTYLPSPTLVEFAEAARQRPEALASLVSLLHSGSKASVPKLRAVADVVGGILIEGLGMTENSGGLVTATVPDDVVLRDGENDRLATVGRPVPDAAVRLVDPSGAPLPHDGRTVGELLLSSPALMVGYWKRPDATAEALVDGWYRSGDLGTIDAQGYVTVSERRVDLIVSGGMNVYPAEVEDVITSIRGVVSCAVVGVPHERWGMAVAAAIVTEPGADVTEEAVLKVCRERLASYKKPTLIRFVDALPTTASLKISRAAVRASLTEA